MSKYRIAKGEYEGEYLKQSDGGVYYFGNFTIPKSDLQIYLDAGIVEEIQEPRWTDVDMIEFAAIFICTNKTYLIKALESFKQSKEVKND